MAHDLFFGQTKRDWSCGSILLPVKQQRVLLAKVDDVRYDIRRAGAKVWSWLAEKLLLRSSKWHRTGQYVQSIC